MITASAAWAAMRALPILDHEAAFGTAPVLVLAPHPDDESLGCGGLIAEACRRATPPLVAILTDGSQSHTNSRAYPPDRLRLLREQETLTAIAALGLPPDRLVFLGVEDGKAPVAGPAFDDAVERLTALMRQHGCETIVVSWRHDPHCDHEAASLIAAAVAHQTAARHLEFPVWGWTLPADRMIDQGPITGFRLDISRHLARKHAAILAHASQHGAVVTDDPTGFRLPPEFVGKFLDGTETFIA